MIEMCKFHHLLDRIPVFDQLARFRATFSVSIAPSVCGVQVLVPAGWAVEKHDHSAFSHGAAANLARDPFQPHHFSVRLFSLSLVADDEVVLPEREHNIHLAIVRLLRIIRHRLPQCVCGPAPRSVSQQRYGTDCISLVILRCCVVTWSYALNQSLFA
jgi:hypothetical protein